MSVQGRPAACALLACLVCLSADALEKPKKDVIYTSLASDLQQSFMKPGKEAKPWTFWYWMSGNVTREGITYDLESMARAGIGGAYIFSIDRPGYEKYVKVKDPVHPPSDLFWDMVKFAVEEAGRLGMEIALNAGPGWAVAGGPWITPEFAMQFIVSNTLVVEGGKAQKISIEKPRNDLKDGTWKLGKYADYYKDIAVLAYPASPGWRSVSTGNLKDARRVTDIKNKIGQKLPGFTIDSASAWATEEELPASVCVPADKIIDLSDKMDTGGNLDWTAPKGVWIIQRVGAVATGSTTRPVNDFSMGLECDKLNPEAVAFQFKNWYGEAARRVGPKLAGKVLSMNHSDSWECGPQTWSPVFREEFKKRRGYDPVTYLPVTDGIAVGSAEETERFLWDYRRTIVDLISDSFFKTSVRLTNQAGATYSSEVVSGMLTDSLEFYREVDVPMGEFWVASHGQGAVHLPMVSSGAHIYGKRLVFVEAFTERGINWKEDPYFLKALGDYSFTCGVNRYALHVWAHQAFPDRVPGVTLFKVYGTFFSGNQPWHKLSVPWFAYITRCQSMLQQGLPVADVCYFQGEDLPAQAYQRQNLNPALTLGYDFDTINRDALLTRASAQNGRMVLPDGVSYKLLVLPGSDRMSVEVSKKIGELASGGVLVIGPKPTKTYSLAEYTGGDKELADVVKNTWKNVLQGVTPTDLLLKNNTPPDVEFIGTDMSWVHRGSKVLKRHANWNGKNDTTKHRPELGLEYTSPTFSACHRRTSDADFYFVSNQEHEEREVEVAFRITGKAPELWNAETGEMRALTDWQVRGGRTHIPLRFSPAESYFIVFRKRAAPPAKRTPNFATIEPLQKIDIPWTVEFEANRGAPPSIRLEKLIPLSEHEAFGVKYYSGIATYKGTFNAEGGIANAVKSDRLMIDLGEVKNVAEVTLNGKAFPAVWKPPFRVDITDAVKAGDNSVEIRVANTWRNRLLGDAQSPMEERVTWLLYQPEGCFKGKQAAIPSGLIGPVGILKKRYAADR
jgi:hypothetical protein